MKQVFFWLSPNFLKSLSKVDLNYNFDQTGDKKRTINKQKWIKMFKCLKPFVFFSSMIVNIFTVYLELVNLKINHNIKSSQYFC